MEDVRTRVVACHVEHPLGAAHPGRVEVGVYYLFALSHRSGYDLATRRDYGGVSNVDPFVVRLAAVILLLQAEGVRDVANPQAHPHPYDVNSSLSRYVPQGRYPLFAAVPGRRHVYLRAPG